ncbi:MAG: hypothetical protein HY431_00415 [Candidatus Levybacteria bacterium]|nr:hypothetical protein [Candidatus Levybacteria bacterium]
MFKKLLTTAVLSALALTLSIQPASAATKLFPDLKTLPPANLKLDTHKIDGNRKHILRLTNVVWNAGEGPLDIRSERTSENRSKAFQRIFEDNGHFTERLAGEFTFHRAHGHWHFEKFAKYELWRRAEYDNWIASGRTVGNAQFEGEKTTFCVIDGLLVQRLPNTPSNSRYNNCTQKEKQGLSVGWGDVYVRSLPDQWVVIGNHRLPNGRYAIRSIADPVDLIKESPNNDPARESRNANEATTFFRVEGGGAIVYE